MTLDERAPIDPNTADAETLCLLPGVGPVLAERIIAARPFETLPDLTRVSGIGAAALERWRAFLALPSTEEPAVDSGAAEVTAALDGAAERSDSVDGDAAHDGATKRLAAKVEPVVPPDVPAERVSEAKKEPVISMCDAGLIKIVVPVFAGGRFLGVAGGCGLKTDDSDVDVFLIHKLTGIDPEEIERLSADIQTIPVDTIQSLVAYIKMKVDGITRDWSEA